MTTTTLKYSLAQIIDISHSGFQFEIPEDTCNMINYLSDKVGSNHLTSTTFYKAPKVSATTKEEDNNSFAVQKNRKKRGNKEASAEEWETIRSFQATKMEHKTGIDGEVDQMRLMINKLTDKTFLEIEDKLIRHINYICDNYSTEEDMNKVSNTIYTLCSTNKFYSKVFAELFARLCSHFAWVYTTFDAKFKNIMSQYDDIEYIDSDKDYDGFCEMIKKNEKRRSLTTFCLNLARNGVIQNEAIVDILQNLLNKIINMINVPDKKNEIDELTENVAILYDTEIIYEVDEEDREQTVEEMVNTLAKSKAKDYLSLSNKTIFKFMDLIEM
jgi:hypothetical protein